MTDPVPTPSSPSPSVSSRRPSTRGLAAIIVALAVAAIGTGFGGVSGAGGTPRQGSLRPAGASAVAAAPVVGSGVLASAGTSRVVLPRPGDASPLADAALRLEAYSSNWAGYDLTGGRYTSVAGRWIVPRVTPTVARTASAAWIGVDGASDPALIQVGTEQDSVAGRVAYFAWWEILPAPAVRISSFSVRPGDHISALIQRVATDRWRITIVDARSGAFSTLRTYTGPGTSADWIVEAPVESGRLMTLAPIGPVTFDLAAAGGVRPGFATAERIVLVHGSTAATPSAPDRDGDGFTVRRGPASPSPLTS